MKREIILTENDIEVIINGGEIELEIDGVKTKIRQSYVKDAVMPAVNRKNKVVDTESNTVLNKHFANAAVNSFMRSDQS